jgi:hypothetical protein
MRKGTLTLVLAVVLSLMVSATSVASPATGIAGHGNTGGPGGWDPHVSAQLTPSGVHGLLSLCKVGCAEGRVFQIVPPSATSDHWCIAAHRDDAPGSNVMLYIRDVGDGRTTFDQWSETSTLAPADCTTFPDPAQWLTLDSGDFHAH